MKQSGTTIVFVIVCIGVLVAAYAVGLCIREVRFSGAKNESATDARSEKPAAELETRQAQARRMPGIGGQAGSGAPSPEDGAPLMEQRAGMRGRFENMTEEEREQFRTQMRERFGGRRRDMGPQLQLSEEDRAKMREEIDALRERWDQMSEEEREEARNQISEKYGFTPRGLGSGRGFGDREGDVQRPFTRPDDEQAAPDDEQTTEPDDEQTTESDEEQAEPDDEQLENN